MTLPESALPLGEDAHPDFDTFLLTSPYIHLGKAGPATAARLDIAKRYRPPREEWATGVELRSQFGGVPPYEMRGRPFPDEGFTFSITF